MTNQPDNEMVEPCPFCWSDLNEVYASYPGIITEIKQWTHPHNNCALSGHTFAAENFDYVERWNTRAAIAAVMEWRDIADIEPHQGMIVQGWSETEHTPYLMHYDDGLDADGFEYCSPQWFHFDQHEEGEATPTHYREIDLSPPLPSAPGGK